MPFTMTHLIIADRVSAILSEHLSAHLSENLHELPSFYLGNLAPDAIHQRANYISDFKKKAHLCVGPEKWGMVTNNDAWKESVVNFLHRQKKTANHAENWAFILGYACHILADIYSNIALWIPFKQKYTVDIEKGYGNLYHQETNRVDIVLALTHKRKDFYWSMLRQATGVGLTGLVAAAEVEKQKDLILNGWYKDKQPPDISAHEVVTYESTLAFTEEAVPFILPVLQEYFSGLTP